MVAPHRLVRTCPKCGSSEVVRIVYGYPSPECIEEARRGAIRLGGCCIRGDDPRWACRKCDHRWPTTGDDEDDSDAES